MVKISDFKFFKIWVGVLLLVVVAGGIHFAFFGNNNPSLQDVLTNKPAPGSWDLSLLVASMLALSLATLSAAKGYEIVKRSKNKQAELPIAENEMDSLETITPLNLELESIKTECESYKKMHSEAMQSIHFLQEENVDLAGRIKILYSEIDEVRKLEAMLRKSNIALGKECEKVRAENEELVLKLRASLSALKPIKKPVMQTPIDNPPIKKQIIAKKAIKKGKVARLPKKKK
ncbi:MAG: hypothetical protein WC890_07160 [Candidatus Margulisiibacteriota bacterium]